MNLGERPFCIANPEIVWRSEERFTLWDDCMSFPFLLVRLSRHVSISVRYTDEEGVERSWEKLDRPESELLQHEIDHLDGVVPPRNVIRAILRLPIPRTGCQYCLPRDLDIWDYPVLRGAHVRQNRRNWLGWTICTPGAVLRLLACSKRVRNSKLRRSAEPAATVLRTCRAATAALTPPERPASASTARWHRHRAQAPP